MMGTYYYPVLTNSGGKQLVPNDNELVEWTNNQKAGERAYHYGRLFGSNGKYLKCFGNQLRILIFIAWSIKDVFLTSLDIPLPSVNAATLL